MTKHEAWRILVIYGERAIIRAGKALERISSCSFPMQIHDDLKALYIVEVLIKELYKCDSRDFSKITDALTLVKDTSIEYPLNEEVKTKLQRAWEVLVICGSRALHTATEILAYLTNAKGLDSIIRLEAVAKTELLIRKFYVGDPDQWEQLELAFKVMKAIQGRF